MAEAATEAAALAAAREAARAADQQDEATQAREYGRDVARTMMQMLTEGSGVEIALIAAKGSLIELGRIIAQRPSCA